MLTSWPLGHCNVSCIILVIECHLQWLTGDVAIDCILQRDPGHTGLHLFQAEDLPLALPQPPLDEPDEQMINYYLLGAITVKW